jgi:hypothetical protein
MVKFQHHVAPYWSAYGPVPTLKSEKTACDWWARSMAALALALIAIAWRFPKR